MAKNFNPVVFLCDFTKCNIHRSNSAWIKPYHKKESRRIPLLRLKIKTAFNLEKANICGASDPYIHVDVPPNGRETYVIVPSDDNNDSNVDSPLDDKLCDEDLCDDSNSQSKDKHMTSVVTSINKDMPVTLTLNKKDMSVILPLAEKQEVAAPPDDNAMPSPLHEGNSLIDSASNKPKNDDETLDKTTSKNSSEIYLSSNELHISDSNSDSQDGNKFKKYLGDLVGGTLYTKSNKGVPSCKTETEVLTPSSIITSTIPARYIHTRRKAVKSSSLKSRKKSSAFRLSSRKQHNSNRAFVHQNYKRSGLVLNALHAKSNKVVTPHRSIAPSRIVNSNLRRTCNQRRRRKNSKALQKIALKNSSQIQDSNEVEVIAHTLHSNSSDPYIHVDIPSGKSNVKFWHPRRLRNNLKVTTAKEIQSNLSCETENEDVVVLSEMKIEPTTDADLTKKTAFQYFMEDFREQMAGKRFTRSSLFIQGGRKWRKMNAKEKECYYRKEDVKTEKVTNLNDTNAENLSVINTMSEDLHIQDMNSSHERNIVSNDGEVNLSLNLSKIGPYEHVDVSPCKETEDDSPAPPSATDSNLIHQQNEHANTLIDVNTNYLAAAVNPTLDTPDVTDTNSTSRSNKVLSDERIALNFKLAKVGPYEHVDAQPSKTETQSFTPTSVTDSNVQFINTQRKDELSNTSNEACNENLPVVKELKASDNLEANSDDQQNKLSRDQEIDLGLKLAKVSPYEHPCHIQTKTFAPPVLTDSNTPFISKQKQNEHSSSSNVESTENLNSTVSNATSEDQHKTNINSESQNNQAYHDRGITLRLKLAKVGPYEHVDVPKSLPEVAAFDVTDLIVNTHCSKNHINTSNEASIPNLPVISETLEDADNSNTKCDIVRNEMPADDGLSLRLKLAKVDPYEHVDVPSCEAETQDVASSVGTDANVRIFCTQIEKKQCNTLNESSIENLPGINLPSESLDNLNENSNGQKSKVLNDTGSSMHLKLAKVNPYEHMKISCCETETQDIPCNVTYSNVQIINSQNKHVNTSNDALPITSDTANGLNISDTNSHSQSIKLSNEGEIALQLKLEKVMKERDILKEKVESYEKLQIYKELIDNVPNYEKLLDKVKKYEKLIKELIADLNASQKFIKKLSFMKRKMVSKIEKFDTEYSIEEKCQTKEKEEKSDEEDEIYGKRGKNKEEDDEYVPSSDGSISEDSESGEYTSDESLTDVNHEKEHKRQKNYKNKLMKHTYKNKRKQTRIRKKVPSYEESSSYNSESDESDDSMDIISYKNNYRCRKVYRRKQNKCTRKNKVKKNRRRKMTLFTDESSSDEESLSYDDSERSDWSDSIRHHQQKTYKNKRKKPARKFNEKNKTRRKKSLTAFEQMIEQKRQEKLALLKSLQIDECKAAFKESLKASRNRPRKRKEIDESEESDLSIPSKKTICQSQSDSCELDLDAKQLESNKRCLRDRKGQPEVKYSEDYLLERSLKQQKCEMNEDIQKLFNDCDEYEA